VDVGEEVVDQEIKRLNRADAFRSYLLIRGRECSERLSGVSWR
jgi:hypothetical protein